jgi:plasmid stabilization system protein ParE
MTLEYHPAAQDEYLAAIEYYDAQFPGLGERFHREMARAEALLLRHPEIGSPVSGALRKLTLDTFPYYLIYSIDKDRIYVLAVAHAKRRPGYWATRLQ